jgi:hypothetical protein
MNTKIAFTLLLLCILSMGLVSFAFAQTRVAGVNNPDYMTYSITSYWSSENKTEPVPVWLSDLNNTKEYKVMVGGVIGINVTTTQTWTYDNGTQLAYLITVDIDSGDPYYLSASYPPGEGVECIVGANLNAGDLLHPAGNDSIAINKTISRSYLEGARDTNVIELNGPIQNETIDESNNITSQVTIGNQDVTYYIDKATGVLVQKTTTIESLNPSEKLEIDWNLKETNLWNASAPVDSFLVILVALVAVVVVVVLIVVYRFRRRGRKRRS